MAGQRSPGQVLILAAFGMVALLGMTGVAIDLGFAFAHRRQVQSAADAAALAGVSALSRHIIYSNICANPATTATQRTALGCPTSDPYATNSAVWQEITSAAAAALPPYTDLGSAAASTTLSYPTGTGDTLKGWYVWPAAGATTTPCPAPTAANGVQGTQMGQVVAGTGGAMGTTPDACAVGVRVEAHYQFSTFFAHVLGSCCDHVDAGASARAVLQGAAFSSGPFILCGGDNTNSPPQWGAWEVKTPTGSSVSITKMNIFQAAGGGYRLNPAYNWYTFRVWDNNISQTNSSQPNVGYGGCGASGSAGFKGLAADNVTCTPSNTYPCTAQGQPGTQVGPITSVTSGIAGCSGTITTNCVAVLLVADQNTTGSCSNTSCPFRIETEACFYLTSGGGNAINAQLLPVCPAGTSTTGTVINPSSGNINFVGKAVPDS